VQPADEAQTEGMVRRTQFAVERLFRVAAFLRTTESKILLVLAATSGPG
jgi:hypothetical protein